MSSFKAGKSGDMAEVGKKSTISKSGGGAAAGSESPGVGSGLSAYVKMNVNENEPSVDFARDPLTGNATERIKPRGSTSVSKRGKSFQIDT